MSIPYALIALRAHTPLQQSAAAAAQPTQALIKQRMAENKTCHCDM